MSKKVDVKKLVNLANAAKAIVNATQSTPVMMTKTPRTRGFMAMKNH